MMRFVLTGVLVLALTVPAWAQLADDDYVTKFFGSTAVFCVPKQLTTESGWWGDLLPQALTSDNATIVTAVNAVRSAKGVTPLLGAEEYVLLWGQEGTGPDGRYYYTLDFQGVRPSEVQALFTSLGGVAQLVPEAELSFWPMNKRNFYFSSLNPGEDVPCYFNGAEVKVSPNRPVAEVKRELNQLFNAKYGVEVGMDVYLNQYLFADGGGGADLSLYATIATDLVPVLQYPTEEGMGEGVGGE